MDCALEKGGHYQKTEIKGTAKLVLFPKGALFLEREGSCLVSVLSSEDSMVN